MSRVFEKVTAFKSPRLRFAACAIVKRALECNGDGIYPDDEKLVKAWTTLGMDDKNVIGNAWRWCGRLKIIERGTGRRPSTAKSSNGREVAEWRVVNFPLARTFLKRNDIVDDPEQKELFTASPAQGGVK